MNLTIYFLRYNNYQNKIIRKFDSIEDYSVEEVIYYQENVKNFNFGNGIDTSFVLNKTWDAFEDQRNPDYAVIEDDEGNVNSRWFVLSCDYQRNGQYIVRMHRDVVADNLTAVLAAKAYVYKGYVSPTNPLIFNNENVEFNQIKKGEFLLKNHLQTPWLVCYLSRSHSEVNEQTQETTEVGNTFEGNVNLQLDDVEVSPTWIVDDLTDWQWNYWLNNPIKVSNSDNIIFSGEFRSSTTQTRPWKLDESGWITSPWKMPSASENYHNMLSAYERGFDNPPTEYNGIHVNSYTGVVKGSDLSIITSLGGKIIQIGNEKKAIKITKIFIGSQTNEIPIGSDLYSSMQITNAADYLSVRNKVELENIYQYKISLVEIPDLEATYSFNYTDGAVTEDAAYEIIAAPYNDLSLSVQTGDTVYNLTDVDHQGKAATLWFQSIVNKYHAAGWAYDVQLVPYCPIDGLLVTNYSSIFLSTGSNNIAVAFKLKSSSFQKSLSLYDSGIQDLPIDRNYKRSVNCDMYRIVSPNGIGEYEFSPAKNNGLTGFEIDCTLIPYNPYIKINPIYNGLYGRDYNDYRGLICAGDFSLPIVNNQWETYKLNNKYFQDIFDRQIQSQEYNNKFSRLQDWANAITGSIGASVQGFFLGGPIGAGAAGGASLAAGIADATIGQKVRRESIDSQRDIFELNLKTIQARANTLTRSTSYNINNKYFPYVEYYTCTDEEKKWFDEYIKYQGMTINVIGTISDFINTESTADWTYIKASIIDIQIDDDYEIANEISNIIKGGIRIEQLTS